MLNYRTISNYSYQGLKSNTKKGRKRFTEKNLFLAHFIKSMSNASSFGDGRKLNGSQDTEFTSKSFK